jgi:hypothetical protein
VLTGTAISTTIFSMFNTPRVRVWRNLGILASFLAGLVMAVRLPWASALATWASLGLPAGVLYFAHELFASRSGGGGTETPGPRATTIAHGLIAWPVMLPEVIEYALADLGVLKAPDVSRRREEDAS